MQEQINQLRDAAHDARTPTMRVAPLLRAADTMEALLRAARAAEPFRWPLADDDSAARRTLDHALADAEQLQEREA